MADTDTTTQTPAATPVRVPGHTVILVLDTTWTDVHARITCQAPDGAACKDDDGDCQAVDWVVDDSIVAYSGPSAEVVSGAPAEVWQEYMPQYHSLGWRWAYVEPRPVPAELEDSCG